jgi:hypothetical protein
MRRLLFAMVLVAALCVMVHAQGIGLTYTDKVMWRGFELTDESDALSPQINVDIGGANVKARGLLLEQNDYGDIDNWDAQVSIKKSLNPFELATGFGYYDYPDVDVQFQELWATIGLPIGPVTPRYTLVRAENEGAASDAGWMHVLGADVELTEKADLFAEAVYNDGFSPLGGQIESGWTHATIGASLEVPVAERITIKPAFYYQRTLDEAVNPKRDQVWYSVGLMYKF